MIISMYDSYIIIIQNLLLEGVTNGYHNVPIIKFNAIYEALSNKDGACKYLFNTQYVF